MRHTTTHLQISSTLPLPALLPSLTPAQSAVPSIANYPAGLLHDARNVLAAMDIYCELLKGPGVLNPEFRHLADELHLLRESSSSLMDRLLTQAVGNPSQDQDFERISLPYDPPGLPAHTGSTTSTEVSTLRVRQDHPGRKRVVNAATDLQFSHAMLSALAGPKVRVDLSTESCPEGELLIGSADFTRVLINLVRNAAEAMGTGGRIGISVGAAPAVAGMGPAILLAVEDNGPGIPLILLEKIFELSADGVTNDLPKRRMNFRPRGLGLRIVRELVESGGGIIRAARLPERGSRFEIVLPMVTNVRMLP
jgi:signal transduction histidine kinase